MSLSKVMLYPYLSLYSFSPVEVGDEAECGLQMLRAASTKVSLEIIKC